MKHATLLTLTLGGILMLGGVVPANADQAGDIAELKQQVADLQEAQVSAENSLASRIQIHGSLSQGYLKSDHNDWIGKTEDGTFNFNEFAINFSADLTEKLRAGVQFMSRDLGPLLNNKVIVDWAIADYNWRDWLGVRIGRLKTPWGLYNESRDIDAARIAIFQPFGLYYENSRDFITAMDGIGMYGDISLGPVGMLSYQAITGKIDTDTSGGSVRYIEGDAGFVPGSTTTAECREAYSVQLIWDTPLEGLRLGATALGAKVLQIGKMDTAIFGDTLGVIDVRDETEYYKSWCVSLEYTWNDLIVAAEFMQDDWKAQNTYWGEYDSGAEGWYVASSYRFTDWFAAEVSYAKYYPDRDDKDGEGIFAVFGYDRFKAWQKDIVLSGRFDINEYWIFKAGVTFADGLAHAYPFDNPDGGGAEQDWILYQLKTTVSF